MIKIDVGRLYVDTKFVESLIFFPRKLPIFFRDMYIAIILRIPIMTNNFTVVLNMKAKKHLGVNNSIISTFCYFN